jgi:hypothetical protein
MLSRDARLVAEWCFPFGGNVRMRAGSNQLPAQGRARLCVISRKPTARWRRSWRPERLRQNPTQTSRDLGPPVRGPEFLAARAPAASFGCAQDEPVAIPCKEVPPCANKPWAWAGSAATPTGGLHAKCAFDDPPIQGPTRSASRRSGAPRSQSECDRGSDLAGGGAA